MTEKVYKTATGLLVILFVFAGVSVIVETPPPQTPHGPPPGKISISEKNITLINTSHKQSFRTNLTITYRQPPGENSPKRFEDVQLCVYDQNGTSLSSRSLGSVSPSRDTISDVSVQTGRLPTYIYTHHPQFYKWIGIEISHTYINNKLNSTTRFTRSIPPSRLPGTLHGRGKASCPAMTLDTQTPRQ
jgi:hypothetical protein